MNSDTNGRGFLRMGGSHSFQKLVHESASAVQDPETIVDALTRLRARMLAGNWRKGGEEEKSVVKSHAGEAPPLDALGSGSDYSPFLQHLGIASLDIRYGGEDESNGIYHSIYDSFDHYIRFGDPTSPMASPSRKRSDASSSAPPMPNFFRCAFPNFQPRLKITCTKSAASWIARAKTLSSSIASSRIIPSNSPPIRKKPICRLNASRTFPT